MAKDEDGAWLIEWAMDAAVECRDLNCEAPRGSWRAARVTGRGTDFDGERRVHWFEGALECLCGEVTHVGDSS